MPQPRQRTVCTACGPTEEPRSPWMTGEVDTPAGPVPRVSPVLSRADRWGAVKVRLLIGRMSYAVPPGLYAVGRPTPESFVFVSANYKLSFDRLREQLGGLSAWILALDTKGINVWCAAGKGTFGTDELVQRIAETRLQEVVAHRRLIVPQLGAPGVAAHEVKKRSGFRVVYGPVRAKDLPAYLEAGCEATPDMRRVRFAIADRAVIIPVEIAQWGLYVLGVVVGLLLLSGVHRGGYDPAMLLARGTRAAFLTSGAFLAAVILTPLLLPWLPGRAFSTKGSLIGLAAVFGALAGGWIPRGGTHGVLEALGWVLILPAITAFVAMNYTGSTTFTSQSGVKREMKVAIPAQIAGAALGLGLWVASALVT